MKAKNIILTIFITIFVLLFTYFVLVFHFSVVNKNNKCDTPIEKEERIDYSATYESEDYNSIVIEGLDVYIGIFRLAGMEGKIVNVNNNVATIFAIDPAGNHIEFKFDFETKILKIEDTTWGLLNNGDVFYF